jgi:hypothetical protein
MLQKALNTALELRDAAKKRLLSMRALVSKQILRALSDHMETCDRQEIAPVQ